MKQNRNNVWRNLLTLANADLNRQKISLTVTGPDGKGFYRCNVLQDGKFVETYAENHREDKLSDLVMNAWRYVDSQIL